MDTPFFSFVGDRPAPDEHPIAICMTMDCSIQRHGTTEAAHASAGEVVVVCRSLFDRLDPAFYTLADTYPPIGKD